MDAQARVEEVIKKGWSNLEELDAGVKIIEEALGVELKPLTEREQERLYVIGSAYRVDPVYRVFVNIMTDLYGSAIQGGEKVRDRFLNASADFMTNQLLALKQGEDEE